MKFEFYTYKATCRRIVDGDTLDVCIDLGLRTYRDCRIRLAGVNAPEKSDAEGSKRAVDFLVAWVGARPIFVIQTFLDKDEKYGRLLGRLWPLNPGPDDKSLNQLMAEAGVAKPYMEDRLNAG